MTSTETRAVPKRTRPKDRREQILREAFALIAEAGFNAVSLADIAKACDIQKSSVLHHFPSMNDLLLGVLAMREDEDYGFYAALAETDWAPTAASARDRLTRVFTHNLERPEFVRLYALLSAEALAPGHPAHGYITLRNTLALEEMARALAWKPNPHLAAVELIAFWTGIELAWSHDQHLDALAAWEQFADRFFVA